MNVSNEYCNLFSHKGKRHYFLPHGVKIETCLALHAGILFTIYALLGLKPKFQSPHPFFQLYWKTKNVTYIIVIMKIRKHLVGTWNYGFFYFCFNSEIWKVDYILTLSYHLTGHRRGPKHIFSSILPNKFGLHDRFTMNQYHITPSFYKKTWLWNE